MSEIGDNSAAVNAAHLRSFIERVETLETEIRDLNEDKSELYKEAKSSGFDAKIIKKVVAMRRMDRDKRMEEEAILSVYLAALGMVD